jgi:hypothetical protein
MISIFKTFWKNEVRFEKKLTTDELETVRRDILRLTDMNKISSQIIEYLQNKYPKLKEKWQAERVYWTESKRMDSSDVKTDAQEIGLEKFIVMPNTNACELCMKISGGGKKVFKRADMVYKGRAFPPCHPNCLCIVLPYVE